MSETWTPEKLRRLRDLAAAGETSTAIAKAMRLTRGAVMGKIRREGIQLKGLPAWGPRAAARPPRVIAKPKAAPPAQPREIPRGVGPAILALRSHDCRWPIGSPTSDDFRFCSVQIDPRSPPYCRKHTLAAISPNQRRIVHGYEAHKRIAG